MNKVWTILLGFFLLSYSANAQSGFEGEIIFEITYTGEGASEMVTFLPYAYQFRMKGTDLLFKIEGGMMAAMLGEMLIKGSISKGYLLNHDDFVAYEFPLEKQEAPTIPPTVTALDETEDILGYSCMKYKVQLVDEASGTNIESFYWVTEAINFDLTTSGIVNKNSFTVPGVKGFVLKTTSNLMGMTVITQVKSINAKTMSASLFEIPRKYSIKDAKDSGIPGF